MVHRKAEEDTRILELGKAFEILKIFNLGSTAVLQGPQNSLKLNCISALFSSERLVVFFKFSKEPVT